MITVVEALGSENLFSRPQARRLERLLAAAFAKSDVIHIDFAGARMISPSFFDEILWIIEESSGETEYKVYLMNASEPLDRKFSAVAAGHILAIRASGTSDWVLSESELPVSPHTADR